MQTMQRSASKARQATGRPARNTGRVVVASSVQTSTVTTTTTTTTKGMSRTEVEQLYRKMEARAKALISLEEASASNRAKVKLSVQKRLPLGSTFKLTGSVPEWGNFNPEVSPYLKWNNGDVWTWEGPVRAGKHSFKVCVRHPDGTRFYEDGQDRTIEVPSSAEQEVEVKIDGGKLSWPYM